MIELLCQAYDKVMPGSEESFIDLTLSGLGGGRGGAILPPYIFWQALQQKLGDLLKGLAGRASHIHCLWF